MRILLLALAVVVATLMGPELGGAASIPSPFFTVPTRHAPGNTNRLA